MKIAIVLAYESCLYAGLVRPFINWAKKLRERDIIVDFYHLHISNEIIKYLQNLGFRNIPISSLINNRKNREYDIVLLDDWMKRFKIIEELSKNDIRIAIYVQALYGIHSIAEIPKSESNKVNIIYSLSKVIPFSILKRRYLKVMKKADIIICNSQITATFLRILYGIEPNGVVYPPIDTEIFKPYRGNRKDKILVYLGNPAGDTEKNFVREICNVIRKKGFKIITIGNKYMANYLKKHFNNIVFLHNISDEELAKTYSECKIVICPQLWEQFGYAEVEAMACGTPVLAFNYMGPRETIIDGLTGWLAYNRKEFMQKLKVFINGGAKFDNIFIRKYVVEKFSAEHSTDKLITLLEKSLEK